MRSIQGRSWWTQWATFVGAAVVAVGFQMGTQVGTSTVFAAFQLPEGERITNLPHIPRAIPQKEAYELYDPKIGKNFDMKNFWLRADLRVRPEFRNNGCFGSTSVGGGACNTVGTGQATTGTKGKSNDFYVQQWVRLGIGYDLSPDVNFYMEIIDSATWGGNGINGSGGAQVDALNHNGSTAGGGGNNGRLGVRAAYVLVRNLGGVQGLSMKAGRQYIIFGNHSLFGHFDWANTGFSHDGVMFQYSTKDFDSYFGWFRNSESDLGQAAPVGALAPNIAGSGNARTAGDANRDADMFIFYNQIKSVPGFLIEPYYILYKNNYDSTTNVGQGIATTKHSNQTRHMIGNRIEMRKGNWDAINETIYQFGAMGHNGGVNAVQNSYGEQKNLHINAWATRNWIGYTHYQSAYKPRLAFNLDYASGDGRSNCTLNAAAGRCSSANTFEGMFPTNHIHMGYMDVQAWKNMLSPSANLQFRPSKVDHVEFWYTNLNLANSKDNWYRGAQGAYVFSKTGNTKTHVGDELDFTWTHMFADGKMAFQATYGHMFAGGYIAENLGTSADQSWGFAQIWMNF